VLKLKGKYCRFFLTLLIVGIFVVSMANAATISFEPSENSISPGTSANFTIVLDSAPDGLSGYNLNVVFSNPDIVDISGVTFPPWASMNNVTYPTSGVARMSAVDIGATIGPGAGPIKLGTITMTGKNAGSTDISITQVNIDADSGGTISPSLNNAHLSISGSNSGSSGSSSSSYASGSSSGGGGYSGSSSSGGGTTSTVTPALTKTIQSSAVTTGVTQNPITKTVSHESPVVTGTPKVTNPVQVESTQAGNTTPFPWVMIVEIIVVIGIIGGAIVLYFVRKGL
jgi:hypothetical protein